MLFALGFIAGIAVSTLVIVTLSYFRRLVEQKMNVIATQIENAGPRPRGFIIEPESDAEEARAKIIARNRSQGKDTSISELQ